MSGIISIRKKRQILKSSMCFFFFLDSNDYWVTKCCKSFFVVLAGDLFSTPADLPVT